MARKQVVKVPWSLVIIESVVQGSLKDNNKQISF